MAYYVSTQIKKQSIWKPLDELYTEEQLSKLSKESLQKELQKLKGQNQYLKKEKEGLDGN